jgi:hypothetical protein
VCRVEYDDLMELARLCLLRASAASTPAVAEALRAMADEYQARAAALMGGQRTAAADGAPSSSRETAPSAMQQQQQPQGQSTGADPQPIPTLPRRP